MFSLVWVGARATGDHAAGCDHPRVKRDFVATFL